MVAVFEDGQRMDVLSLCKEDYLRTRNTLDSSRAHCKAKPKKPSAKQKRVAEQPEYRVTQGSDKRCVA